MPNIGDVKGLMDELKASTKPKYNLLTGDELLKLDIPPMIWMSHMLIPHPGLVAISGQPGAHKTFFAMWLAMRIADGKPLFDESDEAFFAQASAPTNPPQANVLFIEEENTAQLVKGRYHDLKPMTDGSKIMFLIEEGFKFTDSLWCDEIKNIIKERSISVVILDSFVSCMGIKNENDNAEIAAVLDVVRHEFVKQGLTVIFIHHPSKSNDGGKNLRGAGDILGKMDVHLCLTKDEEDKRKVKVSYEKMRVADETTVSDFEIRLTGENDLRTLQYRYLGTAKTKKDAMAGKILEVMKEIPDGCARDELAEYMSTGKSDGSFRRAWDKLKKDNLIYQSPNKRFYVK